ncbi:MAG: hypothetical protein ACYC6C_05495 [Coriobacteriia bacterium]
MSPLAWLIAAVAVIGLLLLLLPWLLYDYFALSPAFAPLIEWIRQRRDRRETR